MTWGVIGQDTSGTATEERKDPKWYNLFLSHFDQLILLTEQGEKEPFPPSCKLVQDSAVGFNQGLKDAKTDLVTGFTSQVYSYMTDARDHLTTAELNMVKLSLAVKRGSC
jgi:hypothetical protein